MTRTTQVSAHYAAGARGDLAGMMADFAPDIEWVEAAGFPLAGTYRGPSEIAGQVFARIAAEWEGFGMVPDELFESGETVIALGRYVGTHRATGLELEARAVHVWRFTGALITGFEQVTDTLLVARAAEQGSK